MISLWPHLWGLTPPGIGDRQVTDDRTRLKTGARLTANKYSLTFYSVWHLWRRVSGGRLTTRFFADNRSAL
ncbi:hypothetical protein OS21_21420 [Dickeya oryzae]